MADLSNPSKPASDVVLTRNRHPRPPYDVDFQLPGDEETPQAPPTLDSIRLVRRAYSVEAELSLTNDESVKTWEIEIDCVLDPRKYDVPEEAVAVQTVRLVVVEPRMPRLGGPSPCFVFIHGGVLCAATAYVGLHHASLWARLHNAVTVSVEYGLAPEKKGEEPAMECYAALLWVQAAAQRGWGHMRNQLQIQTVARARRNADPLVEGVELTLPRVEIDPRRIIMYGASAGGNLAAAATLLAREKEGPGRPMLCGLFLESPMLCHRVDTTSSQQFAHSRYEFDAETAKYGWECHLDGRVPGESDATTRRHGADVTVIESPGLAEDLSDLPPMYLECGSAEPFRDEVLDFAMKSLRCGGDTEVHVWQGVPHGFAAKDPWARVSQLALKTRNAWIDRALKRKAP